MVNRNIFLGCAFALITVAVMIHPASAANDNVSEEAMRGYINQAAPHPRLLMNKAAEARVRTRIADNETAGALFTVLRAEADKIVKQDPAQYNKTGKRLLSVSREVLRRVLCLSFVYRITDERPYAERAVAEMEGAAAFSDWNPSHFLDVAEMSAALAIGYDWLHDILSPDQESTLRAALIEKGIEPSYSGHHTWVRGTNNWNQVCHGGLTLGALALLEHEPELAARVVARAVNGVPLAMNEYAPDGIYPEGPSYWAYGTTYNVLLIDALETALGTDFGLAGAAGFSETGAFPLLMTGPTGNHFTFSDCGAKHGPFPAVFWFARRLNDPGLTWLERPWLEALVRGETSAGDRFLPLFLLWWDHQVAEPPRQPLHWKGEGVNPLAVHRSSWTDPNAVYLAVKAGRPNANHGHMDIGAFILEADGVRWALDFGAQRYHGLEERGLKIWNRAQNSERWQVYRYHNRSHNTLLVNDAGQVVNASAAITGFSDAAPFPHTLVCMRDVYSGQLARAERGFALLPDGRVLIRDELAAGDAPARVRWAMTTPAEVEAVAPGSARLRHGDKSLFFEVLSPGDVAVEVFSTDPPNEWDAPNPGTRQVGFYVELEPEGTTALTVLLTPGSVHTSGMAPPAVHPLASWSETAANDQPIE